MAGFLSLFQKKKTPPGLCSAVIVAAGSARRMEGIDKILAPLGELPVLVHTLYAFQDCPAFDEVVVVTREDLLVEVSRLCKEYRLDKVTKVVVGGAERIHSVRAGLQEVNPEAGLIAIHDGARPLVTREVLEEAVARAWTTGAAAPAIPVTDTIKREENGQTVETVDRSQLRAVQTPQVFEAGLIRAALEKAVQDGENLTDDCAAVERIGMKVSLTAGSRENIKITTPFDLLLGEAILESRVRGV
ncbi:2-C-methyl-D-erythritol 4-phosphate cytidylyltransferase [Pseudoflavonifractor phocaeensis]|uniref:2-C-methyl-D-erythritol 4-phosphate cytidylyltransferase n=1 Tax=Pseudoflavonifractor phocaeensis TaxID=1870988 RepID=UPI001F1E2F72|nr:2-C-methyl-D-erythritol 4-phosphate cytidylyltransferase [Pseudoflavonifractor phocaeensis]MCF2596544.1 2-C-methyl-D-erythritol 4-phosphate cytidylyltransferase [Pseudoflavonifractor phocaeensis]MDY3906251.1 2-C-methyl-D-erythritol 4-phosphate cytidylyltransferase [Lawsonibacter sp.]